MPRQPLQLDRLKTSKPSVARWGTKVFEDRPEQAALIGNCIVAWSHIEDQMAGVLTILLDASSAAAIAVYKVLRRSTARIEAIKAAAEITLNEEERKLLAAIIVFFQSVEKERNDLAHGTFMTFSSLPDDVIWIESSKRAIISAKHRNKETFILKRIRDSTQELLENAFSYRTTDIQTIFDQIKRLELIMTDALSYLNSRDNPPDFVEKLFRELLNKPHIRKLGRP
jgi:hypothetical protein